MKINNKCVMNYEDKINRFLTGKSQKSLPLNLAQLLDEMINPNLHYLRDFEDELVMIASEVILESEE